MRRYVEMNKKRIISLVLLLSIAILPMTNVLAQEYEVGEKIEFGKYTGVVIAEKDVPEGIKPLKILDMKEIEDLLAKTEIEIASTEESIFVDSDISTRATGSQTKRMSLISGLYVKAYYTYAVNPTRFGSCTNVVSYISGRPFADWTQTSYNGIVIDSGRTLAVNFSGFQDLYLLTPLGLVKINTIHADLYTEFYYTGI